jgi:cation transport ATPase
MMPVVAVDPEEQALAQSRQAQDEAQRQAARMAQALQEPEQQREWIRQHSAVYGGLIAVGLLLVQPFLTATALDWSARICVLAFSVAIPLLAGLVLLNHQEGFRRRASDSTAVRVTQSVAQGLAFAGLVAGFWHITWPAGVAVLVSSFVALLVHSAGYFRLERAAGPEAGPPAPAEQPPGGSAA